MSERLVAEVVVIGAGLSGLAAAAKLEAAGVDTLVVEARERVGGRACSVRLDDGTVLDLGGQWIGATHHRLAGLGRAHGVPTFRQHDEGHTLIRAGGKTTKVLGKVPFRLGPASLVGLGVALLRLDRMARSVPVLEPWAAKKADRWDSQTLGGWINGQAMTARARAVLSSTLTGIFAAEPAEISLLHALTYIRAGEGIEELTGTVGGAQDSCFRDGVQTVADRAAAALAREPMLERPVRRICQEADGVTVEADELVVEAERVIVALPPALAGRIDYSPALPAARDQLTQRVPQGSAIKCFGVYETPFWRGAGPSGLVLDTEGPVSMVMDGSPDPDGRGILIGFLEGRHARRGSRMEPEARRAEVLRCFVRHFGRAAADPLHYLDQDWSAEPFTRGCYAGVMPPGAWTGFGEALRAPVGRIHWAGTETATEWIGYFEGALEAGERAAGEVIAARPVTPAERATAEALPARSR
jgi:monoamine oxidase